MTDLPMVDARSTRACRCVVAAAVVLLALNAGCGRRQADADRGIPATVLAVLEPATPDSGGWLDLVSDLFPSAKSYPHTELKDALSYCVRKRAILVITDARALPQDDWPDLQDYLQGGGAAVFLGAQPLQARARRLGDVIRTQADMEEEIARMAFAVPGFSSIQSWRHKNSSGRIKGAVRVEDRSGIPWRAVEVQVEDFREWDAMMLTGVSAEVRDSGANTMVFYARGDAQTGRLAVVCRQEDGSHWKYVVSIGQEWRRYILHEDQFTYFYGGDRRAKEEGRFSIRRLDRSSIGLSMHLAPQSTGNHTFGLSDIYLAQDARSRDEREGWPAIPMLAPPGNQYPLTVSAVQVEGAAEAIPTGQSEMESPIPRGRGIGIGGGTGGFRRWFPLARAYDSRGELLGWPAGLYVEVAPEDAMRRWAWVGARPEGQARAACRDMLLACLRRLYGGAFLLGAGSERFSFEMGDPIEVQASWYEGDQMRVPLRVAVEMLGEDGRMLRRLVSSTTRTPAGAVQGPVTLKLAKAPGLRREAETYTLRILLEDATGNGDIYDELEQRVKVLPVGEYPVNWVTVEKSHFLRHHAPLFLMGINYRPISVNAFHGEGKAPHWLDPQVFDPWTVDRDFDFLHKLKVNAVAFTYTNPRQAPQLRYLIEVAREHDILILLHIPGLSPLSQDYHFARKLINDAGLRQESQVFAFDLADEPRFGRYAERVRFDDAWRRWLVEQFGSLAKAEKEIGFPMWKQDGLITGPPDEALSLDGEHRVAVAVYRRFLDDLVSRKYGEIRRFLNELGCRQLLTARTGYGGTGTPWVSPECPVDIASGSVHLDFVSPVGWHLQGDEDEFKGAGFLTAYARGMSDGKPVVWLQFGTDVGSDPGPPELDNQEQLFQSMFNMVSHSAAAGCFAWWYPGGFNRDKEYDMGVVHPSGLPRPAAETMRTYATNLRSVQPRVPGWKGREMLRERDARGLPALWNRWHARYREEAESGDFQDLRPFGFGKPTTDMPLLAVGGGSVTGREPLLCLNAEWGLVHMGESNLVRRTGVPLELELGRQIDLQLINTGPATWSGSKEGQARTVWVIAQHESKRTDKMKVSVVPFGRSVSVNWQPTYEGAWRIRPWLSRVGPFGEELEVVVTRQGSPP